jgi:hypothetical protein
MIATILGTTIPIAYILIGASVARYVKRTLETRLPDDDTLAAIFIGMTWPIAFPFYLAIHGV